MDIIEIFEKNTNNNFARPYIIAEAGVNHEGNIDKAKRLIEMANKGGADAIKFQTYKAEYLASKNSPSYWNLRDEKTESQYKLFKKYDKFWKKEYEILKNICDREDIEFLSTPFDKISANFLNDLMRVFKISSSDINNFDFINYICKFKKPIILSTGASNIKEIKKSTKIILNKKINLCLLHCILNYPTLDKDANLGMITDLKKNFKDILIGYSDHTKPKNMKILEVATLLGARIIEKHFTFNKKLKGNDHYHSMDYKDLLNFNKKFKKLELIIGSQKKDYLESEVISRQNARRSLVAAININKNQKILKKHLTWKRPGSGISVENFEKVLGKSAKVFIKKDTVLINKLIK